MYHFSLPPEELKFLVSRFYEIDLPADSSFEQNWTLPTHMGSITFVIQGELRIKIITGIHTVPPQSFSGRFFPAFSFECETPTRLCGIVLKPTAMHKLFGIHLAEVNNDCRNLTEAAGERGTETYNLLTKVNFFEQRVDIMTRFLLNQTDHHEQYDHLDVIIDLIYQYKGLITVSELCDIQQVSRSYIEKRFKKMIGITPGRFIKLIRFHFACAKIAEGNASIEKIFSDFGYYDRSHFLKTFKSFHKKDLSEFTSGEDHVFKTIFKKILRSDTEKKHHP